MGYYKINQINTPFGKLELWESFEGGSDTPCLVTLDNMNIGTTKESLLKFIRDTLLEESVTIPCSIMPYGIRFYTKDLISSDFYKILTNIVQDHNIGVIDKYGIIVTDSEEIKKYLGLIHDAGFVVRMV